MHDSQRAALSVSIALATALLTSTAPVDAGNAPPPMYTLVELHHVADSANSLAIAISDPTAIGPVVGGQSFSAFITPTLSWRAVVWRPDVSLTPLDLLTVAQAGNSSVNRVQDVSPNGQYIVGYSNVNPVRGKRWTYDAVTNSVTNIETLGVLAGDGASEGVGVNSAGRAVGYSLTDSSTTRGVTWAPGTTIATLLPAPAGSGGLRLAREISEAPTEYIVGRCDMSSTPTTQPIIWKPNDGAYGTGEILQLLSATQIHDAVGIMPNGQFAVGLGATADEARGVRWNTTTNQVTDIGGICCFHNVVYDMNDDGVGVGYTGLQIDVFRAVLYWNGEAYDLSERVVNVPGMGQSLFLHVATGINSAGQIVGKFGGFASGEPLSPGRVFILTPVSSALPGDLNNDQVVDESDRAVFCDAIGSSAREPGFIAAADLNDDGVIDHFDQQMFNNLLPPCDGDVVSSITFAPPADGVTDAADLAYLLGAWGSEPSCADFVTSRTFAPPPDGNVDGADLAALLGNWGACD
jgi:hypothetical protein